MTTPIITRPNVLGIPVVLAGPTLCLSEPLVVNLCVYRGDSGRLRVTVTDADGAPVDISGATWDADVRLTADAAATISEFEVEPVVGDPSSVELVLTAANSRLLSANCVYDLEMTLGGEVQTLITGMITVTHDVSRTP